MSYSLTGLFGKSPRVEILEFFAEYADDDVSVPFLAEHLTASPSTIHKYLAELVREGLVVPSVKEGRIQFYKLNLEQKEAQIITYLQNQFLANEIADQLHEMGELTLTEEMEARRPRHNVTEETNLIRVIRESDLEPVLPSPFQPFSPNRRPMPLLISQDATSIPYQPEVDYAQ